MEVVGMISGVVSLLETTGRAYDKLKKMKDLPQAFLEVHQRLPIAQEILKAIDAKYDQFTVADARLIAPTVQACHKNAKALKAILERLPPRDDVTSSWDTLVKQYITIVKIQGKGERVEDLTKKILRDIQLLVNFEIIKKNEVTKSNQLQKLKDAIEAIERVDPSVSTHELQAGGFGSITHGGQGDQNVQMGDYNNQFNHSGSGNNIKEANFAGSSGQSSPGILQSTTT
ncbi:hypothetical protein K4K53_004777 [Colletotrichum sp. SAR 10_77]|nr:hypothetical protein K4K53_004777 [Colletotrichum sp. SAR 10_77]